MDPEQHLAFVASESALLADTARTAGPEITIPSCPGWTMARLVKHAGTAQRWATACVERRAHEPVSPRSLDLGLPDDPAQYPDWYDAGAARLVAVMSDVDPDEPIWSWGADRRARFWPRRMAHESAVHRWDAQAASGSAAPMDGELAADGIDELLANLPFVPGFDTMGGEGETIHLHRTDGDGEWLIRWEPGGLGVTREHAKGDVAVRATASDLHLLLVNRVEPEALEVFGDAGILARWRERVHV